MQWHKFFHLDELPEFNRSVLEVMRQPLEDYVITSSRTFNRVSPHKTMKCKCKKDGILSRLFSFIVAPLMLGVLFLGHAHGTDIFAVITVVITAVQERVAHVATVVVAARARPIVTACPFHVERILTAEARCGQEYHIPVGTSDETTIHAVQRCPCP